MKLHNDGNTYFCLRGYPSDWLYELRQTETGVRDHMNGLNGWISDNALVAVSKFTNQEIIDRAIIINRRHFRMNMTINLDTLMLEGHPLVIVK